MDHLYQRTYLLEKKIGEFLVEISFMCLVDCGTDELVGEGAGNESDGLDSSQESCGQPQ